MTDGAVSRVQIKGGGDFDPRDWLRREVLWAYLMTPYSAQAKMWLDGRAIAQHNSNVTRQRAYEDYSDTELQSLAFFNHGKKIAGIISSAVLFKVSIDKTGEGAHVNILSEQAEVIDKTLNGRPEYFVTKETTAEEAYQECARLVRMIEGNGSKAHLNNMRRLRASHVMSALACRETKDWIASSLQNPQETLPLLTIPDGGSPRSAGDRVDKLQPILNHIIASAQYQALSGHS